MTPDAIPAGARVLIDANILLLAAGQRVGLSLLVSNDSQFGEAPGIKFFSPNDVI